MTTMNRRQFISTGVATAAAGLSGCVSYDHATPRPTGEKRFVRVDAHTHIFNGEDIDGVGYLFQERSVPEPFHTIGKYLTKGIFTLAKLRAPGARFETRLLDNMLDRRAERMKIRRRESTKNTEAVRGYTTLLAELESDILELNARSYQQKRAFKAAAADHSGLSQQDFLNAKLGESALVGDIISEKELQRLNKEMSDPKVLDYVRTHSPGPLAGLMRPATWWRLHGAQEYLSGFLKGISSHRIINAIHMMRRYPEIDLFVAATMDVDQWFVGAQTHGNLQNPSESVMAQAEIMGKISILTEGRVLGRTGFDPLRQALWDKSIQPKNQRSGMSPFDTLKESCEKWGSVGAKLYPVVGFRPLFNSEQYGRAMPRENAKYPTVINMVGKEFGLTLNQEGMEISKAIDDAMRRMFAYCDAGGFSVMAHTNHSHGASDETKDCTAPWFFAGVAGLYKNVRINLGHFGDLDKSDVDFRTVTDKKLEKMHQEGWPLEIAKYFGEQSQGIYADFSFTEPSLRNMGVKNLGYFLKHFPASHSKTMYGSDWHELLSNLQAIGYYRKWTRIFEETLPFKCHAEALLGGNAIAFNGLRPGDKVRNHIDNFFAGWNVRPEWARLVDQRKNS